MVLMDGEVKCDNIFSQIIEKDQMVEAGTKVLKSYFTPNQIKPTGYFLPRIPVYRCHSNFRISEDIFNVNPALFRTCFRECMDIPDLILKLYVFDIYFSYELEQFYYNFLKSYLYIFEPYKN
jgi:hypothetical protein